MIRVHPVLSASTMIGDAIKNPQGEKLGVLKEVMLDVDHGRVAYAVMSFGGLLGMGEKLLALPWRALRIDTEDHSFILDAEKEKLKEAEGFDKDHWPDFSNDEWRTVTHSYWGLDPNWS